MVQLRQSKHSLRSGDHPARNSLRNKVSGRTRFRRVRTRGREQDDGRRVAANSTPQPALSILLLQVFPAKQTLAFAPPYAHMQAIANYYTGQQEIYKRFSSILFKKDITA